MAKKSYVIKSTPRKQTKKLMKAKGAARKPRSKPVAGSSRKVKAAILESEWKYFDTNATGTVSTTAAGAEADPAGGLDCINCMAQGDAMTNRDGNDVCITRVQVRGDIRQNAATAMANMSTMLNSDFKIALVVDHQTNGVQENAEDVYVDGTYPVYSWRNLNYSTRFTVLKEKIVTWDHQATGFNDAAGTGAMAGPHLYFELYADCEIPVKYSSNNGNITDIVDNSIHVIIIGNLAATYQYEARVRFYG